MSRIKRSSLLVAVSLALCAGFSSCKDDDLASDEHYQVPEWLKGNAYEVLQREGDHSIFLRAIDLSDYQEIVAGKSIMTVIAPSDAAFTKFLSSKGYGSIDELDRADHAYLNKLVGYHLMYYSFDWNKMVNFRPQDGDGATSEALDVYAGYYYKHRTHAADPIEERQVAVGNAIETYKIYHQELYLPVFSNRLFETKGIDARYNYTYFYPDTEWAGSNPLGSFNIANGRVEGDAVVTDNGYLYNVDHVIEPLNTLYNELALNPKYSKFLSIYDRYAGYTAVTDTEILTSLGYQVYLLNHGSLPPIAMEWVSERWQDILKNEKDGYNLFVPSNVAIDDFFNRFWTQETGYSSVDDLDPKILEYFVMQSFAEDKFIIFPEEIRSGEKITGCGTVIDIDPDQVTDRKICANGAFYGMDHMELPSIFSSVAGPVFKDKDYLWYLYALDGSKSINNLASKNAEFVTLIPNNEQLAHRTPEVDLVTLDDGTKALQQYDELEGRFVNMGSSTMKNIADIHIAQNVKELKTSGIQVIPTFAGYNFWFVKDGKITTSALFNEQLNPVNVDYDPFVEFKPILNDGHAWTNGASYSYGGDVVFEQASGNGLSHYLGVCNDKNFKYYMFAQLLNKAGLISSLTLDMKYTMDDSRFILFCPTNEAITQALANKAIPGAEKLTVKNGEISGTVSDKNKLADYLDQYFITSMFSPFTTYPYVGSDCKGAFTTVANGEKLSIYDNGSSLSIGFPGQTPVPVSAEFDYLPFAYSDGCLHFIDGIL